MLGREKSHRAEKLGGGKSLGRKTLGGEKSHRAGTRGGRESIQGETLGSRESLSGETCEGGGSHGDAIRKAEMRSQAEPKTAATPCTPVATMAGNSVVVARYGGALLPIGVVGR